MMASVISTLHFIRLEKRSTICTVLARRGYCVKDPTFKKKKKCPHENIRTQTVMYFKLSVCESGLVAELAPCRAGRSGAGTPPGRLTMFSVAPVIRDEGGVHSAESSPIPLLTEGLKGRMWRERARRHLLRSEEKEISQVCGRKQE